MSAAMAVALLVLFLSEDSWRGKLPAWARGAIERAESQKGIAPSTRLQPYSLHGDFDGDGRIDLAVLVSGTENRKAGILVVFRDGQAVALLGAGVAVGNGGDDFSWMDVWSVYPRGPVERVAGEAAPPALRGDALLVEKSESASALIYWNGKAFLWRQQGD